MLSRLALIAEQAADDCARGIPSIHLQRSFYM